MDATNRPDRLCNRYVRPRPDVASDAYCTIILLVGDCECPLYSNRTYGTKVKNAIKYNQTGSNIQIVKESDFFGAILD